MHSTSHPHRRLNHVRLLTLAFAFAIFGAALATDSNLDSAAASTPTLHHYEARFYNALADDGGHDSPGPRARPSTSSSSQQPGTTISASATTERTPTPGETIDCQQPLATFVITHAAIVACPLCRGGGNGDYNGNGPGIGNGSSNNGTKGQSNHTGTSGWAGRPGEGEEGHAAGNVENMTVTIRNPAPPRPDIHCRVSWDTAVASPRKFPIAKQMDCDRDNQNQLNAVVEKQASGAAAGFFLFVWNNNQMETIAAWRVRNITTLLDGESGWTNGSGADGQRWYFDGAALLNQMPAMLLSNFLQLHP